jgi:hypothetical protein
MEQMLGCNQYQCKEDSASHKGPSTSVHVVNAGGRYTTANGGRVKKKMKKVEEGEGKKTGFLIDRRRVTGLAFKRD